MNITVDMFTGEIKEQTPKKQKDTPISMFTVAETVEIGAKHKAHDLPAVPLTLEIVDVRTEAEKEESRLRAAERENTSFLDDLNDYPLAPVPPHWEPVQADGNHTPDGATVRGNNSDLSLLVGDGGSPDDALGGLRIPSDDELNHCKFDGC